MKNILFILLVIFLNKNAFAAQNVNCKIYNGNDGIQPKIPLSVDLVAGAKQTTIKMQSALSAIGEFNVGLRFFKFDQDLGGDYRLTVETSAVGNPKLKAITFINSKDPVFSGRVWLNDKSTAEMKMTYVDFSCSY